MKSNITDIEVQYQHQTDAAVCVRETEDGEDICPPSSCLERYRKSDLEKIAAAWLAIVKSRVDDKEQLLSQDLRVQDLISIIRRLNRADRQL